MTYNIGTCAQITHVHAHISTRRMRQVNIGTPQHILLYVLYVSYY